MTPLLLWWFNFTAPQAHEIIKQSDGGVRCICSRLVIAPSAISDSVNVRELIRNHWNEVRGSV